MGSVPIRLKAIIKSNFLYPFVTKGTYRGSLKGSLRGSTAVPFALQVPEMHLIVAAAEAQDSGCGACDL
jgi:hypothetical protein